MRSQHEQRQEAAENRDTVHDLPRPEGLTVPGAMEYADGRFFVKGSPDKAKTIQDVALMTHVAWNMQAALRFIDDFLPAHNLNSLEALAQHLKRVSDR